MLIVACKFIRLFEKVYDNNTLSSRLTRPFQASTFGVCELNFRVGMGATTMYCRCWLPFN